jgi:hypothetical protein
MKHETAKEPQYLVLKPLLTEDAHQHWQIFFSNSADSGYCSHWSSKPVSLSLSSLHSMSLHRVSLLFFLHPQMFSQVAIVLSWN